MIEALKFIIIISAVISPLIAGIWIMVEKGKEYFSSNMESQSFTNIGVEK